MLFNLDRSYVFILSSLVFTSCGKDFSLNQVAVPLPAQSKSSSSVAVYPAPMEDCPSGGTLILSFIDNNGDGIFDEGDSRIGSFNVCNGVAGAQGGLGRPGANGVDGTNGRDGVDGENGPDGPDGPDGVDGMNGRDGVDGENGRDGLPAYFRMGAVGAQVKGKAYSACHHDYLYFPNLESSARGWLLFRHQKNGTADQGVGQSGFQVWNVDIEDFQLQSEVANVVYCTLKWDAKTQRLDYLVVDNGDGLANTKGSIFITP